MRNRTRNVVVILLLIAACVAGLMVSAVAQVRDAAARMTCSNNLKQLSMGVVNYQDIFRKLPPLTDQGEGAPTGNGLPSMFYTITPYIESRPMMYHPGTSPPTDYYADSSVPFTYELKGDPPPHPLRTVHGGAANCYFKPFICPADGAPLRDVKMTLPDGSSGYYSTGSYVANGLLPWNRNSAESISKGAANVIMLAERPQVCRTATGDTIYNLWGVGFYSPQMPTFATLTPTEPPGLWTTGQIAPAEPLPDESDRESQIRVKIGRVDATPGLPDFANPIQRIRQNQPCDPRLPGTPHAAGMQVAMADASVRVFTTNTTPWVFWSACTPTKP